MDWRGELITIFMSIIIPCCLLKINLLEPDSKEYKQFERTKDIPDKIIIAAHGNYKGDIIDINKNIISVQMLVEII